MIDARLTALQQLRTSYLAAKAAGVIGAHGDVLPPFPVPAARETTPPVEVARISPNPVTGRAPRGMIAARVTAMVNESPRPVRVREMVASLRELGATAPSLSVTVHGVLNRLRHKGLVERTSEGWLSHAVPIVPATPPSTDDVTPAPAPVPAITATPIAPMPVRPRRARRPRPRPVDPPADRRPDGLAWRIESLLKSHGQPVAARYVADATGEPLNVVGLTLGRMVRQQRVERQPDGHFAVVVPMAEESANGTAADGQSN